jgi:ketosteroid isomerase-like protein
MKTGLLGALIGLAISFALPSNAQRKHVADPQTTQKILAIGKALDQATNNNDPDAIAAVFSDDAVFLTDRGPITGRQAIQKWYADVLQGWHPKNHITKVDGNAPHLIGTNGKELWATGEWSETGQVKGGEPISLKGYWLAIYLREGDDWKIRIDMWNQTPESWEAELRFEDLFQ